MRLLWVNERYSTAASGQMKAHAEKLFLQKRNQEIKERRLSSAAMLLELPHQLPPRVMTGYSQNSQSRLCHSNPPLLLTDTARQGRFPHSQALPTFFVSQMDNFPPTVLERVFNTLEEQSTLLPALVSLLLTAFTPSSVLIKHH